VTKTRQTDLGEF